MGKPVELSRFILLYRLIGNATADEKMPWEDEVDELDELFG